MGQRLLNTARLGGPCPPGGTHRYFFNLYALDTELELIAGASKEELLRIMEGHVLASTETTGVYRRQWPTLNSGLAQIGCGARPLDTHRGGGQ